MADNAIMYGFRWQRSRGGTNLVPERVRVASAYQASPGGISVDLRPGDPVKKVSDGTVALVAVGDPTFGIVVGIGPYFDGTRMRPGGVSLPGGTAYGTLLERQSIIYIVPVAGEVFEIDCDDNVTATTEATFNSYIGENCDITLNAVAGSTYANPRLDISTHNTTATLDWRIVDIARFPNDFTGNYVKLLVTANTVQQAPIQATGV